MRVGCACLLLVWLGATWSRWYKLRVQDCCAGCIIGGCNCKGHADAGLHLCLPAYRSEGHWLQGSVQVSALQSCSGSSSCRRTLHYLDHNSSIPCSSTYQG
jgi:hypothetical protein